MDSTRQHFEDSQTPGFGPASDLKRLKTNGSATVAEIREFLGAMRGRKPEEVLGAVAGSTLVQSMVIATIGTVLLLVIGSVGPWAWNKYVAAAPDAAAKKPVAAKAKPADRPAEKSDAKADKPKAKPVKDDEGASNLDRAIKAMGMDETKTADPKKNPLDKDLDNLLDKVD